MAFPIVSVEMAKLLVVYCDTAGTKFDAIEGCPPTW